MTEVPGPLEPVVPPQSEEPAAPPKDLFETGVGVVTQPVPTLRSVVRAAPLGQALVVIAVTNALGSIVTVAQMRADPPDPPLFTIPEGPGPLVAAALLGPLFGIVLGAIFTGGLHVISLMLGGKGSYKGLFCGSAFAQIPYVLQIPLQLAGVAFGGFVQGLVGIVTFGIAIWTMVLGVIAVRETHDFSTGRAIAVGAIFVGVLIVFFIGISMFAIALLAGGAASLLN